MDSSVPVLSDSRTFRIIPVQLLSAHPLAATVARFSEVSTYTRYPCLRAVANSAADVPPSQATTISFTPSELAGGIVAPFHNTNTVLHADEENMTQRHNSIIFRRLMRFVLDP